jgi:hypothetical protein
VKPRLQTVYNGGKPLNDSRGNLLDFKSNLERVSRMQAADMAKVPDA